MLLQLRLQFMSAMLVFYLILMQPPHMVKCSTTLINVSSRNDTIPYNGNSQPVNQSTTVKPSNQDQIDQVQQSVNIGNNTNIEGNGTIETKFEQVTTRGFVKVYNKADPRKRKMEKKSIIPDVNLAEWHCPNISKSKNLEHLCSCDMPHTLRCSGDIHSLETIAEGLRSSPYTVSLLDCTLKNVSFLSNARIFENVSLHGLVISSGEIKRVHRSAFLGIKTPLQALGLPNNALATVPWNSLAPLASLDRLDLSNNRIKTLGAVDFMALQNLTYLELSDNQISSISLRTFTPLKKLTTLKLNGNRLGDFSTTLQSIGQSLNLRELDLRSNSIKGPLTRKTLPSLPALESLNLDRNLLTSIQNGALQTFPYMVTLSLRHNQIDVLQDHAFSGLSSLQALDLGYNGIVAVSGASLLHLSKLLVLDLTHNFLRALTSDLIAPLPSLRELRLDGNDISIVAKNALNDASELHSLSLQDNPLSCDCTLKPFAEWLTVSKIPSQDLLGAICATPPHLEGAPLLQIPVDSLNCDGSNEYDNSEVLQQLDIISKHSNLSYVKDLSDVISLKNVHLSEDYGIILTWSVNLRNDEFKCDAVFVYKETNVHEILLDNSPINCESYTMNDENIVSVILRDTAGLMIDESYRFCLVLLQEKKMKRDLIVGCSNVTKLLAIQDDDDNVRATHSKLYQTATTNAVPASNKLNSNFTDISIFDKVSNTNDEITNPINHEVLEKEPTEINHKTLVYDGDQTLALFGQINKSFLPGLGIGILITSLLVIIWGAKKFRNERNNNRPGSTCYSAAIDQISDIHDKENRNRYLKLQATTSL